MKNWIIVALVAVIAVGGAIGAFAATRTVDRVVEGPRLGTRRRSLSQLR